MISKKKKKKKKVKGLRQNSGRFFSQFRKFKRLRGGSFRMGGGAIFHFSQKIGLKSTKNMRFCILHKPMGGARAPPPPPPPPGYATVCNDFSVVLLSIFICLIIELDRYDFCRPISIFWKFFGRYRYPQPIYFAITNYKILSLFFN